MRRPLMTVGVIARIHYQALRLWLKRVEFFSKLAAAGPRAHARRSRHNLLPAKTER
ncbi:MAG: DUF1365 family protein [Burkholderiales bacterium]